MTKDLIMDYLSNEGYRPTNDNDGDISFKADGKQFWIITDEEDQTFLQLVMPHIYDLTEENRAMVMEVCNLINRKMKVVKATVIDHNQCVWLNFEIILDTNPKLEDLIPRGLKILKDTYNRFYEEME